MRRMLFAGVLAILAMFLFAPVAMGQRDPEPPCTGASERYLADINGCVTTEGHPDPGAAIVYDADTREPIGTLRGLYGEDEYPIPEYLQRKCEDFASQEDAQQYLENIPIPSYPSNLDPTIPNYTSNLDPDGDGVACEDFDYPGRSPYAPQEEAAEDQYAAPLQSTTQAQALPAAGGPPLLLLPAGALILTGSLMGMRILRRQ